MFSEFCVVFLKDNKLVVLIVFDLFLKKCLIQGCVNLFHQARVASVITLLHNSGPPEVVPTVTHHLSSF